MSEYHNKYYRLYPWRRTLDNIKTRCNNPKATRYNRYGGRGIQCLLTLKEVKQLWFRDGADKMKRPSIDRINNDGHYEFSNCRFIETSKNSGKDHQIKLGQFDLTGKLIKVWSGCRAVERSLNYKHQNISSCCNGKLSAAYGFKWRHI
jgi:hypothetical protein